VIPLLALLPAGGPPLDPSPDRAHDLLRRELLRPEYHDDNLLQKFLGWLRDQFESGLDAASRVSPIGVVGASVVLLVLLVLLGWLLSRARRTRRAGDGSAVVLTDERVTAAELRRRAEAALAGGDTATAVVEGFRAITVRQVERGRLADQPGATAHEVATALAARYADRRGRVDEAAFLFDLVLYGDRPATADQAAGVLALDDELAVAR
jgi:hypothetical protein